MGSSGGKTKDPTNPRALKSATPEWTPSTSRYHKTGKIGW